MLGGGDFGDSASLLPGVGHWGCARWGARLALVGVWEGVMQPWAQLGVTCGGGCGYWKDIITQLNALLDWPFFRGLVAITFAFIIAFLVVTRVLKMGGFE